MTIQIKMADVSSFVNLISWVDSPETLMQFAGPYYTYPLTKEQLLEPLADPHHFAFQFTDTISGQMVAYAELYVTEEGAKLRRILVGRSDLRGKGIGAQIVQQLLQVAFNEKQSLRANLNVFDWNTAAIRCYEKAGFVMNSDQRWERVVNGETWVAINMVLDREDWNRN